MLTRPVVTLSLLLTLVQAAQDPQNVFRAGTTLVPVDVRVIDREGKPVTDLAAADFTIRENGVLQSIAHFSTQAFTPEPPAAYPGRPRRAADALELSSQNQRTFLIVLGRGRLQEPSKGLDAMLRFVRETLLPQDMVAVAGWNRATDFTTDHESVAQVIEKFKKAHGLIEAQIVMWQRGLAGRYSGKEMDPGTQKLIDNVFGGPRAPNVRTLGAVSADVDRIEAQKRRAADAAMAGQPLDPIDQVQLDAAAGSLDDMMSIAGQAAGDLGALYRGIEYLRGLAGEKQLIFLSEYGLNLPQVEDDRNVTRTAADARVVLNVIHSGGMPLGGGGAFFAAPAGVIQSGQTARMLAGKTGGLFFAHQFSNASMDADRIDRASRFRYELGYYPTNQNWDGRYRKIAVTVNRPGLTVLTREGFFARKDIPAIDRKGMMIYSRVASAAMFVKPLPDIAITVRSAAARMTGRTGRVTLDISIDLSRVDFLKQGPRNVASIEVAAFAVTDRQQTAGHVWQTAELTYTDARLQEVRVAGLPLQLDVPITAPVKDMKIVVYDYGADLVGSLVAKVTSAK